MIVIGRGQGGRAVPQDLYMAFYFACSGNEGRVGEQEHDCEPLVMIKRAGRGHFGVYNVILELQDQTIP